MFRQKYVNGKKKAGGALMGPHATLDIPRCELLY